MPTDINVAVGSELRGARAILKLSQAEAGARAILKLSQAEAAARIGIPPNTYQCYEGGRRPVSFERLIYICHKLGLDPVELFTRAYAHVKPRCPYCGTSLGPALDHLGEDHEVSAGQS